MVISILEGGRDAVGSACTTVALTLFFMFVLCHVQIEFPLPDIKTKRRIFNIHTGRMSLSEDVDLEEFVMAKDELSGADIKAVCTEAGLLALRERRMRVTQTDFRKAKEKALYRKKTNIPEGLYL